MGAVVVPSRIRPVPAPTAPASAAYAAPVADPGLAGRRSVEGAHALSQQRAHSPLAITRGGQTRYARFLSGHPLEAHTHAHEAVHRAQHRAFLAGAPAADRAVLEQEAERGAHARGAGHPFVPRHGAPPSLELAYDPPPLFDEPSASPDFIGPMPLPEETDARTTHVVTLSDDEVQQPSRRDIVVFVAGDRLVALPAAEAVVFPRTETPTPRAPQAPSPARTPVVTVPTIAKEGLRLVNVGGRSGIALDAGGQASVVFSGALAEAMSALGVTNIRSVVVMHIHEDHVRSLARLILEHNIRPENVHYPAAFEVNPGAPGSTFARQMQQVRARVGSDARFSTIPTPSAAPFFHHRLVEGDVRLDMYGLTEAFQRLTRDRQANRAQPTADRASLLVRATHEPSGTSVLFLGDLRGADLTAFQRAMPREFEEVTRGVTVISGFQHHLGALEGSPDRAGLRMLIEHTLLQTGSLDLIVQTQEQRGGGQYVNRSLIEALRALGVNVHLAKEPGAGGPGAVTAYSTGAVRSTGGGTETLMGTGSLRHHAEALDRLGQAERTLSLYGRFTPNGEARLREVRESQARLRSGLSRHVELTLEGVHEGASGRAQESISNADAVRASAEQLNRMGYVEIMPAEMAQLRELRRTGPHLEIVEEEMRLARDRGRLSDRGMNSLWELNPRLREQLIESSALPRRERRRIMQSMPGGGAGGGSRMVAGALLVITIANELAPLVQAERQASRTTDVERFLGDILWWQGVGVAPDVQGVDDNLWPYENEWTTDPERISTLLADDELDYLAVTGIDDAYWDVFMLWVQLNIKNLGDWRALISDNDALQATGSGIEDLSWSYRTGKISGTTFGHDLTVEWVHSDRLTTILRAAGGQVVQQTRREIQAVASGPGPVSRTSASAFGSHQSIPTYQDMPQATGVYTFRPGLEDRELYTLHRQDGRDGFDADTRLYVFPPEAARWYDVDVPDGYVLVGGADYNSYVSVINTSGWRVAHATNQYGNAYTYYARAHLPLMLARPADLVESR